MPIGFFDDSSFRFSAARAGESRRAAAAGASVIHTTANWAIDRADAALDAVRTATTRRTGSRISTSSSSRRGLHGLRVMINVTGTPKWANGNKTPNRLPTRLSRPDDVHEDARDAVQRPHRATARSGSGRCGTSRTSSSSCAAVFAARRSSARRTTRSSTRRRTRASRPATRWRRSRSARRRRVGATSRSAASAAVVAPGTFAKLLGKVSGLKFDAWAHHPYPTSPNLPPLQKVRYPNVTLSTLPLFEKQLKTSFHRTRADLDHRVRPRDEARRAEGRHDREAVGVRQAGADDREERSERADVRLVRLPRLDRQPVAERPRGRERRAQAGVQRLQRHRSADRRPDAHGDGGKRAARSRSTCRTSATTRQPGTQIGIYVHGARRFEGGRARRARRHHSAPTSPCRSRRRSRLRRTTPTP